MIYIIIILAVGIVMGFIFTKRGKFKFGNKMIEDQAENKAVNMEKIREYFERMNEATNNDIQKMVGISDATATRYLDEMEKAGEIKQIGTEGAFVRYQRVH